MKGMAGPSRGNSGSCGREDVIGYNWVFEERLRTLVFLFCFFVVVLAYEGNPGIVVVARCYPVAFICSSPLTRTWELLYWASWSLVQWAKGPNC